MQVRRLTPDNTRHGVGVSMVRKAGRRAYIVWLDVHFVDAEDFSVLSPGDNDIYFPDRRPDVNASSVGQWELLARA